MAGIETVSNGEAMLMEGYTVGILQQEPQLDESKSVLGNVEGASPRRRRCSTGSTRSSRRWGRTTLTSLLAEMGKLQERHRPQDAWDLDGQLEQAMDALRCPPPDADIKSLSGGEKRRVALCQLLLQPA